MQTRFSGLMALAERILDCYGPVSYNTAGNVTLTAADLLGGMITRDCNGGARADNTPTAAQIIAALPDGAANVGSGFEFTIRNTSGAANTITLTAGTGVTIIGTATITQSNCKTFLVRISGPTTVDLYSLGTAVF